MRLLKRLGFINRNFGEFFHGKGTPKTFLNGGVQGTLINFYNPFYNGFYIGD
jgi:hypothetical protein